MDTTFSEVVTKVIAYYPLKAGEIYLLSYKGKKAVWSIQTDMGEVIMKKVPFDEGHIKFMIHAIDYLRDKGIHTPKVYKTSSGEGFVKVDEEYFVVFEAVYGRSPEYEHEEELKMILQGMASFHKASQGIESPIGTFPSFLLTEWKSDLQRRCERLIEWKNRRLAATDKNKFDGLFLQYVDFFLKQGEVSLAMFDHSCFDKWVEETKVNKSLCHQDYAAGNLAIGDDGHLYVFDMDSLTVDLPVRDLRKIINKVMKKLDEWDQELLLTMLQAYQTVNPLTKEQLHILVADIQFPHLFYGQVSKYYDNREEKWTLAKHIERLEDMIATDISKGKVLEDLLVRLDEVVNYGHE
ncbi:MULTISPECIES: CotS family spore coat protein [unclassified Paenibacillus]|uniref:CotS family spore coat protein n=1 Tax=unclassified Paenibacillus TaxID=185978 RepID=UPI003629DA0E